MPAAADPDTPRGAPRQESRRGSRRGSRRAARPRVHRFRFTALIGAGVIAIAAAVALANDGDGPAAPEAAPVAESLAALRPAQMEVVRVEFCDLVPPASVAAALDGEPEDSASWGNGDVPPGGIAGSDVAHEFGCAWSRGQSSARAWVFARPVRDTFARRVIAQLKEREGCETSAEARFGDPAVAQTCQLARNRIRVRLAGLFSQSWVTCEVADRAGEAALTARAGAWCAAVASAIDSRR